MESMKSGTLRKKGLRIEPLFEKMGKSLPPIKWVKKGVHEFPDFWSETAAEIVASKYFRKTGKTSKATQETSLKQLIHRVLVALEKTAKVQKYFASSLDLKNFLSELRHLIVYQKAAFNSPVWFNVGLWEVYKAESSGEHWAYDFKSKKIRKVHNIFERPQCSACFIQSVDDSLEGIFELVKNEAKLFKYGSGTGTNFSTLRSKYDEISVGGTSSGLISFLEVFDKGAGSVKSGGTTRRAAKMVLLDDDHPELLEFISWKSEEEKKAQTLIKAGYSSDFEGPAYKTVSGQNSNNSVRFSNDFMKALVENKKWFLRSRIHGKKVREIQAKEIWSKLSQAAWSCADPGVQFSDTINEWHTCSTTAPIRASNPCSEYLFLDDSACNLASLNLIHFFDQNGKFKSSDFEQAVKVMTIAQEILVDYSSYPTQKIAQNSHDCRPLGLGFANLGSVFMRQGLSYDSDEARSWASVISSLMTAKAYATSAEISESRGAFHGFKKNKSKMLKVIGKHLKASQKIHNFIDNIEISQRACEIWKTAMKNGQKHGFRNAQVTVIAPTGTIGLMMDCDTLGIEPDFSLIKFKKLAGGGSLKLINSAVKQALIKKGYTEVQAEEIEKKFLASGSIKGLIPVELESLFKTANGDFPLSGISHLKMMQAVQPFISGAISKTVNLPQAATPQDISEIFLTAWRLGLKAVAVYRDNSKGSQPLQTIECLDC
ncbi:MAG: vitamin B12-dependent ribonucleotide reductase [Bdellovibrionales bacterium]